MTCVITERRRETGGADGKGEEPARLLEQGGQQVLEGRGGGQPQSALRVVHRNNVPLHPYGFMIKKKSHTNNF